MSLALGKNSVQIHAHPTGDNCHREWGEIGDSTA